jgi:hypothetical protein
MSSLQDNSPPVHAGVINARLKIEWETMANHPFPLIQALKLQKTEGIRPKN